MSPATRNKGGRLSRRELAGYAVLSVFLAIAGFTLQHGRIIAAWLIGAAGFAIAAMIAGRDIDVDQDNPPR